MHAGLGGVSELRSCVKEEGDLVPVPRVPTVSVDVSKIPTVSMDVTDSPYGFYGRP